MSEAPVPSGAGAYALTGGSMTVATAADLADIDEALLHLSLVPEAERGTAWRAYLDALLEQRTQTEDK